MRTDNVFPVIAVDDAGNVYAVWSEADSNDPTIHPGTFFSYSTDQGTTWSAPVQVNQAGQSTTLFPWIDAAGDGGVDIVYYGTPSNVNGGGAVWNVFMAESTAAMRRPRVRSMLTWSANSPPQCSAARCSAPDALSVSMPASSS